MLKANLCKISYIPVFSLYAVLPLIHDVMLYHSDYRSEDWIALVGMYGLGLLVSSPLCYLLNKADKHGGGGSFVSIILLALLSLTLQIICLYLLWENAVFLYLAMSAVMVLSAALFAIGKKEFNLIKDRDTGYVYKIRGNKAYRLTDSEMAGYQSGAISEGITLAEFSSSQYSGLDTSSSVLPMHFTSSNIDCNQSNAINPASGMPMIGGISGLDVHGNSWGTNFNEPSNTYDPNRGY